MNIVLYFINWNDSFYLPFIKKHYGKFCSKIIMYDNYSDDQSLKIARGLGFEVRVFGTINQLNDQHYLDIKNHAWKECRGKGIDYVIVCDADEFISIKSDTITSACPTVKGFDMISDSIQRDDIFEINTGYESDAYSKQCIFSPDKIREINYKHGCHVNHKEYYLEEKYNDSDNVHLYHYRQIGGVLRLINRHREYRKRMSIFNRQYRMGFHYMTNDNEKIKEFNENKLKAKVLW